VHALGIPIVETPVAAREGDDDGACVGSVSTAARRSTRDALFFYVGWRLPNPCS
jgi:hypothetical protein